MCNKCTVLNLKMIVFHQRLNKHTKLPDNDVMVLSFEISVLGWNVCFCFGLCVMTQYAPSTPG